MSTFIYPYNQHSGSAKALSETLGVKRLKRENSRYRPRMDDIIINWGCSDVPINLINLKIINDPDVVKNVTNKLSFLNLFYDEGSDLVVPFTTSNNQVREWLAQGKTVVARTILTGHSGAGIVLLSGDPSQDIPNTPLYTLYVPKKHEYRVHVLRKQVENANNIMVFDIQQKKRKNDVPNEEVDWRIRNLDGGFIYAREDLAVPGCVEDVALKVFEQTGLDFGAVDIIYQEKNDRAYALEVNTAPGLTGTTLDKYVEMFNELI